MNTEEMGMMGIELLGQCVEATAEQMPNQPEYVFKLKILDLIYTVVVPEGEAATEGGAKAAWTHLLQQFFINHAKGNSQVYQDGQRELSKDELEIIENSPKNRKQRREKRREKRTKSGLILL